MAMGVLLLLATVLLAACGQPSRDLSAFGNHTDLPVHVSYCEFSLDAPVPRALHVIATRRVPTEGDERVFYDYSACGGHVPVSVELVGSIVGSIEITGRGNCFEGVGCVGDTYAKALQRFPNAHLVLSRVESATFSLLVRDGVTLTFDPAALAENCYDHPAQCDSAIRQSRAVAIYLYDQPQPGP